MLIVMIIICMWENVFCLFSPIGMQAKAADPIAYYSCDDNFSLAEKAVRSHEGEGHSEDRPHKADEIDNNALDVGTSSLEGTC